MKYVILYIINNEYILYFMYYMDMFKIQCMVVGHLKNANNLFLTTLEIFVGLQWKFPMIYQMVIQMECQHEKVIKGSHRFL